MKSGFYTVRPIQDMYQEVIDLVEPSIDLNQKVQEITIDASANSIFANTSVAILNIVDDNNNENSWWFNGNELTEQANCYVVCLSDAIPGPLFEQRKCFNAPEDFNIVVESNTHISLYYNDINFFAASPPLPSEDSDE